MSEQKKNKLAAELRTNNKNKLRLDRGTTHPDEGSPPGTESRKISRKNSKNVSLRNMLQKQNPDLDIGSQIQGKLDQFV